MSPAADEFRIEYVELPNGRLPAREFVDSLDDKAAARVDAFMIARAEQLRKIWIKHRNHYPASSKEREGILKELGL
jgi:hypothetical protein